MSVIATMKRPATAEEFRLALYHLLNDNFEHHSMIDTQGGLWIEYRDSSVGENGLDIDILIVDSCRHPGAQSVWAKWADDAPDDDGEDEPAAREANAEPQLRVDALLATALNAEEQHFLRMVRTLLDSGYTSSQLVRRLMHHTGEGDPAEWPPLNGHVEGDRLPGLLRKTRSAIAKLFESDFDRRVQRVECSGYANGGCTFVVSFKGVKSQPDQIQIQIGPVR